MNEMNNMNNNQEVYYVIIDGKDLMQEKNNSFAGDLVKSAVGTVLISAAVMGGTALAGLAIDKVVIPVAETAADKLHNVKNNLKAKIRNRKNKEESDDELEIL